MFYYLGTSGRKMVVAIVDSCLWVWGSNHMGQLGLGYEGANVDIPTKVPGFTNIIRVTTIGAKMVFLTAEGRVYGCGRDRYNLFGQITPVNNDYRYRTPIDITPYDEKRLFIKDIALGHGVIYYLTSDNKLYVKYGECNRESMSAAVKHSVLSISAAKIELLVKHPLGVSDRGSAVGGR